MHTKRKTPLFFCRSCRKSNKNRKNRNPIKEAKMNKAHVIGRKIFVIRHICLSRGYYGNTSWQCIYLSQYMITSLFASKPYAFIFASLFWVVVVVVVLLLEYELIMHISISEYVISAVWSWEYSIKFLQTWFDIGLAEHMFGPLCWGY